MNQQAAPPRLPLDSQPFFGAEPWIENPTGSGPGGVTWRYNPVYFATPRAAAKVATLVGGDVVEKNAMTPAGPFSQDQPNRMVAISGGRELNAGLVVELLQSRDWDSDPDALIGAVTAMALPALPSPSRAG